MTDLRQRYAEAIAAKYTYPDYRCDRDGENERVENPEPADRIDQTPYVMVTAGDGYRSFWTPTCAELAETVAAVRDDELAELREQVVFEKHRADTYRGDLQFLEFQHKHAAGEQKAMQERAEKAEAANARTRERLDALIAAGFGAVGDTLRDLRRILDGGQVEASPWAPVPVPRWAVEALTGPSTIQERGQAERALATALAALDGQEADRG